jgi:hypothetical protein
MTTTWRNLMLDQLDFYWGFHLQPRLKGLTDEEYLWEPAEGAWSLREDGDGVVQIEFEFPEQGGVRQAGAGVLRRLRSP